MQSFIYRRKMSKLCFNVYYKGIRLQTCFVGVGHIKCPCALYMLALLLGSAWHLRGTRAGRTEELSVAFPAVRHGDSRNFLLYLITLLPRSNALLTSSKRGRVRWHGRLSGFHRKRIRGALHGPRALGLTKEIFFLFLETFEQILGLLAPDTRHTLYVFLCLFGNHADRHHITCLIAEQVPRHAL